MEHQNQKTSRVLLINKYGDMAFSPGYLDNGKLKLIVSDPDNEVMIDDINRYYHTIQLTLSRQLSTIIPEKNKVNATIIFKKVEPNNIMYIDEKVIYDKFWDKSSKEYSEDRLISHISPIPVVL